MLLLAVVVVVVAVVVVVVQLLLDAEGAVPLPISLRESVCHVSKPTPELLAVVLRPNGSPELGDERARKAPRAGAAVEGQSSPWTSTQQASGCFFFFLLVD